MLKSIIKNKSRTFFEKISGKRGRTPREDMITSLVFGYLDYLGAEDSIKMLQCIFVDSIHIGDDYRISKIELWPRQGRCEPDAVIDLISRGSTPIRILIEAKWGSNNLNEKQLETQWDVFAKGKISKGTSVYHVGIVEHKSIEDRDAIDNTSPEIRSQRRLLTWRDIANNLVYREAAEGNRGANALADDIVEALRLEAGLMPFRGWGSLDVIVGLPSQPIFFNEDPWWLASPVVADGPQSFFRSDV